MRKISLRSLSLPLIVIPTLAAIVCQLLLLGIWYEPDTLLYAQNASTVLRVAVWLLFAVTVAISVVISTSFRREERSLDERVSPVSLAAAGILALSLLTFCWGTLFANFIGDRVPLLMNYAESEIRSMVFAAYLVKYGAYLAIIAAVFPIVMLITKKSNPLFAIFTSVWALTVALRVYFDIGTTMNDPIRMLKIVGFAGMVLALCLETRIGIGRLPDRAAMILLSIAFFATALSAVSVVYGCFFVLDTIETDIFAACALLGTSLLCLDRIVTLSITKESTISGQDETEVEDMIDILDDDDYFEEN